MSQISPCTPVPSSSLPRSNLATLTLAQATDVEKIQIWMLNFEIWHGIHSLPIYLRREVHLATQPLTLDGGITHWVLVDSAPSLSELDRQEGSRTVLASCDTLKKRGLVATVIKGKVKLQEVTSFCVYSVFCRPEYRGRGYGKRLMQELRSKLEHWNQPIGERTRFTALYSDIGKEFYAKTGWKPFVSTCISLPPVTEPKDKIDTGGNDVLVRTSALYADDLPDLCFHDEQFLRQRMTQVGGSEIKIALIPNIETIQWHHAGEEFTAVEMLQRIPLIKGAIAKLCMRRVWCIWTRGFDDEKSENVLHILRLVIEPEDQQRQEADHHKEDDDRTIVQAVAAVLRAAQYEAAEWDLQRVEIWNPQCTIISAAKEIVPSIEVMARKDDESISCLSWYGPEAEIDGIEWVDNEKYGNWF